MSPNPCVQRWGRGPEGATCKTCVHLKYISQAERSYTCSLRTDLTHAPQWGPRAKSDQRLGWDACKRYRESQPLAGEASKDVSAAELEARGEALNAYLDSFKRAFAEMDARKPLASARGGKTEDGA